MQSGVMVPQRRVLGILATRGVNRPPTAQDPCPGRTATFRDIARMGREQGIYVCVFSPRAVDRRRRQVHAHFYVPGQGWVQRTVPLPGVIYNRVANRIVEGRPWIQKLLKWLKDEGVTVFNPKFLDKWDVYDHLQSDPKVQPCVPETVLYEGPGQLIRYLERWGSVYCKPRRGSLGTGIAALRLEAGGHVSVMRNGVAKGTQRLHFSGLAGVSHWAKRWLRPGRICLQRGVNMASAGGKRFDIRALVQKDETGQWRFTGAAARLAAKGQLTTHVPRGGVRMRLDKALAAALHDKERVRAVAQELANLSEQAAASLERRLGDGYGEFSLDIGLDRQGHLWIFEMNAKPFRFDEPEIRHHAYRRLVSFAKYLVEQERARLADAQSQPHEPLPLLNNSHNTG